MTARSTVLAAFMGFLAVALAPAAPARAEDAKPIVLTIKDHKFQPDRIEVAAGKPFELLVRNADATPEEFESHDLRHEKVIGGNSEGRVRIGALQPGEYSFIGEFHEATAKGVIVAK